VINGPEMKKSVDGTDGGYSSTVVLLRYRDGSRDLETECILKFGADKRMTYTIKHYRDLRRSPDEGFAPKIVFGIPK
jgi:hypothetical protein